MSHINLYSVSTDHKNLIRCRFCEKVYKIDNGSSGFIRHLRCKHPEVLHQMGGANKAQSPPKEQKVIDLFHRKNEIETTENNNHINTKVEGNDMLAMMMMQDITSNQFFANFMNQVGPGQSNDVPRLLEKRPRTSPTPIENSVSPIVESTEEPEMKIFNNQNPLEEFLNKINEITQQNGDMSEVNGATEASTSASAMDMPVSLKGSREPTPNSSVLDGTDISDSPPQHVFNPMLPFGCVFCPCSFGQIKDLTFHVGHVHRTRYRCNCCLAEFVQSQQLENHYTMAHVIGGEGAETRNSQ